MWVEAVGVHSSTWVVGNWFLGSGIHSLIWVVYNWVWVVDSWVQGWVKTAEQAASVLGLGMVTR